MTRKKPLVSDGPGRGDKGLAAHVIGHHECCEGFEHGNLDSLSFACFLTHKQGGKNRMGSV